MHNAAHVDGWMDGWMDDMHSQCDFWEQDGHPGGKPGNCLDASVCNRPARYRSSAREDGIAEVCRASKNIGDDSKGVGTQCTTPPWIHLENDTFVLEQHVRSLWCEALQYELVRGGPYFVSWEWYICTRATCSVSVVQKPCNMSFCGWGNIFCIYEAIMHP